MNSHKASPPHTPLIHSSSVARPLVLGESAQDRHRLLPRLPVREERSPLPGACSKRGELEQGQAGPCYSSALGVWARSRQFQSFLCPQPRKALSSQRPCCIGSGGEQEPLLCSSRGQLATRAACQRRREASKKQPANPNPSRSGPSKNAALQLPPDAYGLSIFTAAVPGLQVAVESLMSRRGCAAPSPAFVPCSICLFSQNLWGFSLS